MTATAMAEPIGNVSQAPRTPAPRLGVFVLLPVR